MDEPGLSLFQGCGSIQINNDHQREEEERFAEEKERNAEINKMLHGAFNDLIDDDDDEEDEGSLTSSQFSHDGNFHDPNDSDCLFPRGSTSLDQLSSGSFRRNRIQENFVGRMPPRASIVDNPMQNGIMFSVGSSGDGSPPARFESYRTSDRPSLEKIQERYKESENMEQIKILYEMRLREIERLNRELEAEKSSKDQILRKLAISEKEKDAVCLTLNNSKELLVKCHAQNAEMKSELDRLKDEKDQDERSKNELKRDLDIAKAQILHLEEQFLVQQRCDVFSGRDKHIDEIIEHMKSKHQKEITAMQKEIDEVVFKLRLKEKSLGEFENKLEEMEKKHMATLLNKCDSTVRQEATVKALLDAANSEKLELHKKVMSLESNVKMLEGELGQYESISKQRLFSSTSSNDLDSESAILTGLRGSHNSTRKSDAHDAYPTNNSDVVERLKEELHRALIGQRTKRHEIRKLQEEVQSKELIITQLREKEKSYLAEVDNLKVEVSNLTTKYGPTALDEEKKELSNVINDLEHKLTIAHHDITTHKNRIEELELQIKHLEHKLDMGEKDKRKHAEEYISFHDSEVAKIISESNEMIQTKEREWSDKLEALLEECNDVKTLYIDVCSTKENLIKQLNEEKRMVATCNKERNDFQNQCEFLKKQIKQLEDHIIELNKEKESLVAALNSQVTHQDESNTSVTALKQEIERLRKEMNESKIVDPKDLQKLVDEVAAAKQRYIELEKTLKEDYEANLHQLKFENKKLKEELKIKEMKIENVIGKVDKSSECDTLLKSISEKHLEEISTLEKEIERLKASEYSKNEELNKFKNSHEQFLQQKLKDLETLLTDKHKEDLERTTQQLKGTLTKHYSDQLIKVQSHFKDEIDKLKANDASKFEEMRKLLDQKENEAKQAQALTEHVKMLHNQMAEYKLKTSELLKRWTKEVEDVNEEKSKMLQELETLKETVEKMRLKAFKYKSRYTDIRTNLLPEKYKNLVNIVEQKETEINNKIIELMKSYNSDKKEKHPSNLLRP